MAWEARIKAALRGEVKGEDVAALLAATNPLASLRQQMEDRRLDVQLAHAGKEWLVALELGAFAAPLWLAEALVGIASSFVEAEAEAHPDRPAEMSPLAHDQCLALLYPVGPVIAELSAMAADQSRPFPFTLPATFGPNGSLTLVSLPSALPTPYVRGLLRGAERTQGAAQAALNDLTALTATSSPPAWLSAALRGVAGESAAAATRLEMANVNLTPFLRGAASSDDTTLHLVNDVWSVVDAYLRLGQQAANPLLLPGAPAPGAPVRPPAPAPQVAPEQPPAYQAPSAPIAPPVYQPPPSRRPVPPPVYEPPASRRPVPPPVYEPPAPEPDRALPDIGGNWRPASPAPRTPASQRADEARVLPQIEPGALPVREAASHGVVMPSISPVVGGAAAPPGHQEQKQVGAAPEKLPEIGASWQNAGASRQPLSPHSADRAPVPAAAGATPRRIEREDRWLFSSIEARHRMRALGREDEAERALAAFWEARSWTVSMGEQAYLDEVAALRAQGAVVVEDRDPGAAPFAPVYRVVAPDVVVRGQRVPPGHLFSYDYTHGQVRLLQ